MGEYSSCKKCGCSCHDKQEENHGEENNHEEFAGCLLEAADCAWMEVLKDKIKEHILATHNDRMTELAKIIAEENNHRWKHKMEKKQCCAEFKEKLWRFFSQYKR